MNSSETGSPSTDGPSPSSPGPPPPTPSPGPLLAGRYRHYKGRDYLVLGVARHSETEEELVVYRQEYGVRRLWVRPLALFAGTVEVNGQTVPRFQFLEPDPHCLPMPGVDSGAGRSPGSGTETA
jgi:hypothetical protein